MHIFVLLRYYDKLSSIDSFFTPNIESTDCNKLEETVVIDDTMSSETSSSGVNFIVGDEDGVDQTPPELVNGDLIKALEEEKHENTDSFPLSKGTGRMGVTSNSNSYNNMFGLTEKRKRLRYLLIYIIRNK